jgi:hypothetical protein
MILGCFGTHLYSYMDHIWTVWIIFGLFLDVIGMIGIIGFVKKKATSQICNVNWEHETETLPDFIRRDSHGLTIVMTFE